MSGSLFSPISKIEIIYHSTYGHTKLQAEAVFRGAESVPAMEAKLYTAEEAAVHIDELDAADRGRKRDGASPSLWNGRPFSLRRLAKMENISVTTVSQTLKLLALSE